MIEVREDMVLSCEQMRQLNVQTGEYQFMDTEGVYNGRLELRAYGNSRNLRLFFTLDDGRKVIALAFWWKDNYLGFLDIPNGTYLKLCFEKNEKGIINLEEAEILE